MADNDEAGGLGIVGEAGGSGQGGEDPIDSMQASIENDVTRSEEHTSELQSHYSISYAVFC